MELPIGRPAHRIRPAADASLVALRLTLGSYLAGHGAQKLFGVFGGKGPRETGAGFERLGLAPGRTMAVVAGTTELVGGALTALGLAYPLGPVALAGAMVVAGGTVHRRHGAFAATGGPELPLTNLAAALALASLGPGRLSIDELSGTRLPPSLARAIALGGIGLAVALVVRSILEAHAASTEPADEDRSSTDGHGRVEPGRDVHRNAV